MVQEKDVETFLKAKKDQTAINILQALSLLSLLVLIVLESSRVDHDYTVILATMTVVFMGGAMGRSRWVAVSRSQLIRTLESIINNNPDALKMLADKRQKTVSARKRS